jgi:phosphatidylglycerol:prolipoprotein diacylglycerol transferase
MYLVAFAIAYILFRVQLSERGLKPEKDLVTDFFFWAIVGLLIGARLFAVTIYDPEGYYLRHPLQIILPFARVDGRIRLTGLSGMSYHGGLVGAVVALVIFLRVKKIEVLEWGDMLVTGIPLGYTFGRLGNFINGELYGRVTAAPWGMIFPHAEQLPLTDPYVRATAAQVGLALTTGATSVNLPRHPTQLYEALLEGIVLWAIIWFACRKHRPFKGFVIGVYVIGYGLARFLVDYVRMPLVQGFTIQLWSGDNPTYRFITPLNLIDSQVMSLLMIVAGVALLFVFRAIGRAEAERADKGTHKPDPRKLRRKLAK